MCKGAVSNRDLSRVLTALVNARRRARRALRVDAWLDWRALTRVDARRRAFARRRVPGDMQITLFCFQKLIPINGFMPNLAVIDLTNIS